MKKLLHIAKQLTVLSLFVGMMSCANTEKLLESGNYEKLISVAQNRIKGKKKKAKYVRALETGFNRLQAIDLDHMETLRQGVVLRDWEKVYAIANDIRKRQITLQPHLPLIDDKGYHAKFNFIKVDPMISEARDRVANMLYNQSIDLLVMGREGDKASARKAYDRLNDLGRYVSGYKNAEAMKKESRELGTTRVWLDVENVSNAQLPSGFDRELLALNFRNLNHSWTEFYAWPTQEIDFDYKAVLQLTGIDVSPERIFENEIKRTKTIQDGWTYIKDERGHVLVDSLGNKIKEPKMIDVHAVVVQTELTKAASVRGIMELIDVKKRAIIESRPIAVENIFQHHATRYFGDTRALDACDINIVPVGAFPSDLEMILRTADDLKPRFIRELKACRLT